MAKEFELAQESVKTKNNNDYISNDKMQSLCRLAVAEGCVLLKNNNVLPIKDEKVALFGRCQINGFHAGYGSGGDVNAPYRVSILEGLINAKCNLDLKLVDKYQKWCKRNVPNDGFWGHWPLCYKEMTIKEETIIECSKRCDVALVVIARSAGEDRDIKLEEGSWYLNKKEERLLSLVRKHFKKVCVIVNCGSIMDFSKIEYYNPDALLLVWQGGQEFGNGVADVIMGNVSASGKLTDTIAKIEDYPSTLHMNHPDYSEYKEDIYVGYRYFNTFAKDKIIYPFGYGLSYTKFDINVLSINSVNNIVNIKLSVKNIGGYKGKEVVQVYLSKAQGKLGNPAFELVWFKKTKELEINEEQIIETSINVEEFASFDDSGITGYKNSFVLENGTYKIYVGNNSLDLNKIHSFEITDTKLVKQCNEACAPTVVFERMVNRNGIAYENVVLGEVNIKERILNSLEDNNEVNNKYYSFNDVINNKITLDEFVNSLDEEELEALTRGSLYSMDSPYGPDGNAGTLGASNQKLFDRNIMAISTNDGPSGVRLKATSTLIPNGVVLASTFNEELIYELTVELGQEVKQRSSHILLAPGINIHRNPLCGRNFEYYSEDPYLTGIIASAYIRGVQLCGSSACPKHFACNSQEFNRHVHDSRISQRALREIYIKGFEMCINNANPDVLMTSYNKINGEYSYYSYDLVNLILKKEWGFKGLVITDWWMREDKSKIFDNIETQAYRIRAAVDVYMPGSKGSRLIPGKSDKTLLNSLHNNGITLAEIRSCAKRVLELCIKKTKI